MSKQHPYQSYEGTAPWKAVEKALSALIDNGDLELRTARSHVVGFLTQQIEQARESATRRRTVQAKIRKWRQASDELESVLADGLEDSGTP